MKPIVFIVCIIALLAVLANNIAYASSHNFDALAEKMGKKKRFKSQGEFDALEDKNPKKKKRFKSQGEFDCFIFGEDDCKKAKDRCVWGKLPPNDRDVCSIKPGKK
eukprot:UN02614